MDVTGRFEIVRKLGEGAVGAAFEARDPVLARTVTLTVSFDALTARSIQARVVPNPKENQHAD